MDAAVLGRAQWVNSDFYMCVWKTVWERQETDRLWFWSGISQKRIMAQKNFVLWPNLSDKHGRQVKRVHKKARDGGDVGRRCWRRSRAIINTSGLMKAANNYNLSECCSGDQWAHVIYNRLGLHVLCLVVLEKKKKTKMMKMMILFQKQLSSHGTQMRMTTWKSATKSWRCRFLATIKQSEILIQH